MYTYSRDSRDQVTRDTMAALSRRLAAGGRSGPRHGIRTLVDAPVRAARSFPAQGRRLTCCAARTPCRRAVLAEFAAGRSPRQTALVTLYQQPGLNQNSLADRLFMDHNTCEKDMVPLLAAHGLTCAATTSRPSGLFLRPAPPDAQPRDAARCMIEQQIAGATAGTGRAVRQCLRLIVRRPAHNPTDASRTAK